MSDLFDVKSMTKMERDALIEFKAAQAAGRPWGRKRIVSMQGCCECGYVLPVHKNGLIVDWKLTPAGEAWLSRQST